MSVERTRLWLSHHAWTAINERFAPTDVQAFGERMLGVGIRIGTTHHGRAVYQTPEARIVVAHHSGYAVLVTVMPADWPVDLAGEPYRNLRDAAPAAPASLERLRRRFAR